VSQTKQELGSLLKQHKRPKKNVAIDVKKEIINISEEEALEQVNQQANYQAEVIAHDSNQDPVSELKKLAKGGKKKKLEKERTKCTHWLSDEEIKMLAKLAKATGKPKYEILGTSIKHMYALVLGDNHERKTS
jgi:MFS superfamily sulfate permease-like transporter